MATTVSPIKTLSQLIPSVLTDDGDIGKSIEQLGLADEAQVIGGLGALPIPNLLACDTVELIQMLINNVSLQHAHGTDPRQDHSSPEKPVFVAGDGFAYESTCSPI